MNLVDVSLIAIVAIVCGSMAQLTSKYSRGGWIVHLGLGFMGAAAGVAVARSFTVPIVYMLTVAKTDFPIIWALIGSVFFVALPGILVKPSRR